MFRTFNQLLPPTLQTRVLQAGSHHADMPLHRLRIRHKTVGLEVDYHRFPMLHFIDLLVCRRIYGEEFKRINGACDHTIIAAGTTLHVNVQCKCHAFITHQL